MHEISFIQSSGSAINTRSTYYLAITLFIVSTDEHQFLEQ